jgi:MrfA Zn-binding domain
LAPRNHVHSEGAADPCDLCADVAEAQNAQCFAGKLEADAGLPAAVADRVAFLDQIARATEYQRPRQFDGRHRRVSGGGNSDPTLFCRGRVDGGIARTGRGDQLQVGKLLNDLPGKSRPLAHDADALLDSIVAVHRLWAVTCLYGFTRLEPAPTMSEALLEDVHLAVDGAPLAENADWLPAREQRGEGIFLKIGSKAIRDWLANNEVQARGDRLEHGITRYSQRYDVNVERPGLPYLLLHSLAHALMDQIALECGYPLSSLKERVYAFPAPRPDAPDRFGLLIFTAGAGAQGTLGGLVEIAPRITDILLAALDRMRLCSNDPVCADHDPSVTGDERSLNGAACHACLLIPETSCEARNVYLDRALLVETVAQTRAGLFG